MNMNIWNSISISVSPLKAFPCTPLSLCSLFPLQSCSLRQALLLLLFIILLVISEVLNFSIICATVTNYTSNWLGPVRNQIAAGKMSLRFSEENVKNKCLFSSFPLCSLRNLQVQVVLEAAVSSAGTEIIWTKRSLRVIMRFKAEKGKIMRHYKKQNKKSFLQFFF